MKFIQTATGYDIVTETEGPYSHSAPVQKVVLSLTPKEMYELSASTQGLAMPLEHPAAMAAAASAPEGK